MELLIVAWMASFAVRPSFAEPPSSAGLLFVAPAAWHVEQEAVFPQLTFEPEVLKLLAVAELFPHVEEKDKPVWDMVLPGFDTAFQLLPLDFALVDRQDHKLLLQVNNTQWDNIYVPWLPGNP